MIATTAVEEYLARAPQAHRMALEELREAVLSAVPDPEEVIRRGVPAYRYEGRPLVSIGDAQGHVSLYVMYGATLRAHTPELQGFDTSNTVVRFDPNESIPVGLVAKLVRARAAEIDGSSRA
jgi:uncharacterized protein YdhG (YjbR/CyaY superfamily)